MDYPGLKKNNLEFIETSAKDSINVDKAFESLILEIFRHQLIGEDNLMTDARVVTLGTHEVVHVGVTTDTPSKGNDKCRC